MKLVKNEKAEPMIKMPISLYHDLVRYFVTGNLESFEIDAIEDRMRNWIKDKQDANDRRMLFKAKLMAEKQHLGR